MIGRATRVDNIDRKYACMHTKKSRKLINEPGGEPVDEGAAADGAPAHGLRDDPVEGEPQLRREHPQPRRPAGAGSRDVRRPVAEQQAYPQEHGDGVEPVQGPATVLLRGEQPLPLHCYEYFAVCP